MENPNHKIDEIFRQRLHDSEVPPPPFVWPAVEHGLRKRRRRWALWLFAFGAVSAAASVWAWQSNGWPADNQTSVTNPEVDNSSILNASTLTEKTDAGVQIPLEKTSSPASAKQGLEDGAHAPAIQNEARQATNPEKSRPQFRTKNVPAVLLEEKIMPSAKAKDLQNPIAHDFQEPTAAAFENNLPTQTNNPGIDFLRLPTEQTGLVFSTEDSKKLVAPPAFKPNARRAKTKPKLCYDFARHPSAWLVDVYAGPSLAQRSLTSRQDNEPYLKERLATERRGVAMNAGIRASLMFNSNLLVRTGLNFDQVTEVFEYIDPTTVIYTLKFTPGNPIPDTLAVEYGENYLKTYNRYTMFDIPLLVGMEMRRGRSGVSINAGISANVLFQKRGAIIDPSTGEPARFGPIPDPSNLNAPGPRTALSQEVFRTNLGLSATASIQWYWHLSPHFRVFAEPSFRQVLRPITTKNHPVEQRYGILGLRLGATKIF